MECIEESKIPGESGIYVRKPASYKYEEKIVTLFQNFNQGLTISTDKQCLGTRNFETNTYEWLTYREIDTFRKHLGSFLREKFSKCSREHPCVGIYTRNSPEWTITEQACNAYSLVLVPLCKHFYALFNHSTFFSFR